MLYWPTPKMMFGHPALAQKGSLAAPLGLQEWRPEPTFRKGSCWPYRLVKMRSSSLRPPKCVLSGGASPCGGDGAAALNARTRLRAQRQHRSHQSNRQRTVHASMHTSNV